MPNSRKPVVLMILDGFGHSEATEHNAIYSASTPVYDQLRRDYPNGLISTSGMDVGLPEGQMGNSEVGHMNLGSGRVVYQDFTRITKAIVEGDFFTNPALCQAVDKAVAHNKAVHIMGLLSDGGVHSHQEHLAAMVELAVQRGAETIYVHAFLDGRDTPPRSAQSSIDFIEHTFNRLGKGRIASLIGRYFAMDRDNRWDRVEKAWKLLVDAQPEFTASTANEGLAAAYARDESDEFVKPTQIGDAAPISDGDAVIFMNFRADRAREITQAFIQDDFAGFARQSVPQLADYVMLTQYAASFATPCAFAPSALTNVLGEYLSDLGKTQLRIAETEKYAHVTFFFSGGREEPFPGETRVLIPSPQVATYNLQPEMSAPAVTDRIVQAIDKQEFDVIIVNFANGDMVGHTGKLAPAVAAVETVDECVGEVWNAVEAAAGAMIITADHGNADEMFDHVSGQPSTAHSLNPVPFILAGTDVQRLRDDGDFGDVAPTVLELLGVQPPAAMTGRSLIAG